MAGSTLWLIDLTTGKKKQRYTADGETFRRLKYVDEKARKIYFTAGGVDKEIDPYYQELFVCDMDTAQRQQLSTEKQEHFICFQPDGLYYVDTHSTVQTLPVTQVNRIDGTPLLLLEQADISMIEELYIQPEPFEALARDGKTKIYGLIIKPKDFDPAKKYPVVDYIYGGAQRINTPKAFELNWVEGALPYGGLEYLAHLGFVGVIVDGLATPLRSKEIHDYIYEKAEECCGLADHVAAIRQLESNFPGSIPTASASGALPEADMQPRERCWSSATFTRWASRCAAITIRQSTMPIGASAGLGRTVRKNITVRPTTILQKNLRGKLFLIHGDMDDNVHPAATLKLMAALIEANKDFDSLIFPNSAHGVSRFHYVIRKRWDYFVTHLLGEQPPKEFVIQPDENKKNGFKEERI